MDITFKGKPHNLIFNENGNMFVLEDARGHVVEYMCARRLDAPEPNTCWLDLSRLALLQSHGVVVADMDGQGYVKTQTLHSEEDFTEAVLCRIIHPEFNDQGFSGFGDFCRSRLGQQCQYGSRYIEGKLDGYPALGEGLRFNNGKNSRGETRPLDACDYHSVRIHRDDMDEFERRYKAYQEARLNG